MTLEAMDVSCFCHQPLQDLIGFIRGMKPSGKEASVAVAGPLYQYRGSLGFNHMQFSSRWECTTFPMKPATIAPAEVCHLPRKTLINIGGIGRGLPVQAPDPVTDEGSLRKGKQVSVDSSSFVRRNR